MQWGRHRSRPHCSTTAYTRDLQERLGLTYLFISHDLAVVERVANVVAVMYEGRIVEFGPREEVFETPQQEYTRKLLEAVPVPAQ